MRALQEMREVEEKVKALFSSQWFMWFQSFEAFFYPKWRARHQLIQNCAFGMLFIQEQE